MHTFLERLFLPSRLLALCVAALAVTLLLHTLFKDELEALFAPLVLELESKDQNIYVVRNEQMTILKSGGLFINNNVYNPQRPLKHYLEYTALLCMGAVYCDDPESILVIGLAGGTVPTYLAHHYPEAQITSVDFDPAMQRVAEQYFNFRESPRNRVAIEDGRVFLRTTQERYDLIIIDAFDGRNVPFHLSTREFLELCNKRLNPGGVLAANTPSSEKLNQRYLATFASVFARVDVFQAQRAGNRILVAHNASVPADKRRLQQRFAAKQRKRDFAEMDAAQIFEATFAGAYGQGGKQAPQAPLLTDDYAPVNLMLPPARVAL